MNTLRRVAGYCIIFSYIWAVLEMPVVAYALTGREIVQSQGESVEIHKALPFATKIHVVTKSETIAKLCRRYNISMAGFAKLNKGRLVHGAQQKLQIGSAVIVPVKPLSDAMSRSFDKGENNALSYVSQSATILSNSAGTKERNLAAKRALLDEASEALAAKASSFLNQYGTAQISLVGDDKFSFANSQFAVLLPLYDKDRYNFFVQASYHKQDKRSIGNFGLGERYFANDYMVGANAFFDYDYSRHLKRYGFGAEYGRDYLKAAANVYLGQSGWHKGYDFAKLVERPARGWDVRLQSYLPSAPQLGGKLMFEQYYGDKVALFDKDNLQKDPYAVTVGLDYTPVPLLSFDIDYKRGKESKHAVRLGLNMNYRFGVPLNEQLNPANVSIMRSLAGSRYDLVDRNNDIILEYKQAPGIEVLAPTSLAISAKSAAPIQLATAGANLLNPTPVADPAEIDKYHIQRVGNDIEFDAYVESNKVDLTNVTLTPTADDTYVKQGGAFATVGGLARKPHRIVQHMKLSAPKEDSVRPGPFPMHLSVTAGSYKAGATINVKVKAAHDAVRSLSVDKETLISKNAAEAKVSITYKYKKPQNKKPQSDTQKACFSIIVPGSQAPSACKLLDDDGTINSTVREDTTGNVVTATSTLTFKKEFVKKFVKEHLGKDGVLYTLVPYDVSDSQNLTAHPEAAQEFMLKAYDPKELDANKSELNMDPANDPYVVGTDIKLTFVPKNAAGEDLKLTNLNFKLVDKNGQGVGLIAPDASNPNKATITSKEGDDGVYTIQVLSAEKVVYTKELTIVPIAPEPKEVTQNPTFIDIAKFKAGELKPKIRIAGMTIKHPELLTLDSREGQGIKLGAFTKNDNLLEAEVTSDGTKPKDAYHAILKYNGVALSSNIYEVLSFAPAYDILPFLVPVNTNTTTRVYLHVDERVGDKVTEVNAKHVKFELTVAGKFVAVSKAQVKKLGGLGGAYYATFTSQYAGLAKMTASYKGDVVATESFTIRPEVDIAHSSLVLSKDTVSPNQTVDLQILWRDVYNLHIPGVKELGFVVTDSEHKETCLPATEKGNLYVANYTPKSAGTYTIKATYANFPITDEASAPQFTRTLRVVSGAVTFDPNEMDYDIFINNETADDIYVGKPIPVAVKLTRHEDGNPIDVDMSLISLMVNQENAVNIEAFVRKGVGIYTTHVTFNKGGTYKLHLKIGIDGGDALNPKDIEVKVTPPPPKFPIPSRGFSGITIDVFRPNHYTMHFFPNYGINDPFSASDVKAILPYVHLYVKELGESDDRFKPVNTGFGFHDFNPPPNIVTTDLLDWPGGRTCVFKVTLEDNYGVRFSEKKQHDIIMD